MARPAVSATDGPNCLYNRVVTPQAFGKLSARLLVIVAIVIGCTGVVLKIKSFLLFGQLSAVIPITNPLVHPRKLSGEAIHRILNFASVTRDIWPKAIFESPHLIFQVMTYGALFFEITAFFAMFHHRTRELSFWLLTGMHLLLLVLMELIQVTLGMLLFHLLIYIVCIRPRASGLPQARDQILATAHPR
jgi:hypothetical protein